MVRARLIPRHFMRPALGQEWLKGAAFAHRDSPGNRTLRFARTRGKTQEHHDIALHGTSMVAQACT